MLIECIQNFIPQNIKNLAKPYFRTLFPNKLYAVFWITFRCNYKCSYCGYCGFQDYSQSFPMSCEKSGEEWIKILEKLPPTSFYFSGGEPFLVKDFPYILNNLPSKHSIIGIVTNASMPIEIYKQVNKRIHLNISFHREFINENDFINKILQLKKLFHITVNIVATPENISFLEQLSHICKKNKINLHIDPLILKGNKCYNYNDEELKILNKYCLQDRKLTHKNSLCNTSYLKKCSAGRNFYNIMPNGEVSVCSGAMDYKYSPTRKKIENTQFYLGNVQDKDFKLNKYDIICQEECLNHCDIDFCKIKILKK